MPSPASAPLHVQPRDDQTPPIRSQATGDRSAVSRAAAGLDAWLDTMRGPGGYGGPVAHWWQQSLLYTGPGLDWRYEGIIHGYLRLWERTGLERWLNKAQRAGDDLVRGQRPDGHYRASAFEINPATAGTPHEATCNAALLRLAQALRNAGHPAWEPYADAAERNLRAFYLDQLWDEATQSFRDDPARPSFVPNKAASACEALFALADLRQDAAWVERYAIPTLHQIITHQHRDGSPLDGAIVQNSFGPRRVEKYFPIYIARCVPALLDGYHWTTNELFLDSALRAMRFIARWIAPDGSLPTVVYPNQRVSRHPSWVAPLGDVLRAADLLRPYGFDHDLSAVHERLLAGQDTSGGIQTATGFAGQASGRSTDLPDVRDLLHVTGWVDKAFRYLTAHAGPEIPEIASVVFEAPCIFRGQRLHFRETPTMLEISAGPEVRYRWRKGADWAEVAAPEFWLR